jgi:hypothetical protein
MIDYLSLKCRCITRCCGQWASAATYCAEVAAVTVLTAARIDLRGLERQLARAGCITARRAGGLRVWHDGESSVVDTSTAIVDDLSDHLIDQAGQLLGRPPRDGLTCVFDGPVGRSEAWPTVINIARAAARVAPLAVLDDHAGTIYLIHLDRGLIGPDEYEEVRIRSKQANPLLRRLFGG